MVYERGSFYRADCFFWCTMDGELPDMNKPNLDQEIGEKLVSASQW